MELMSAAPRLGRPPGGPGLSRFCVPAFLSWSRACLRSGFFFYFGQFVEGHLSKHARHLRAP
jgi:hypothetical protein